MQESTINDGTPMVMSSLPGDFPSSKAAARMIRVNQAGEYGAARIYEGQLAVLGNTPVAPLLEHMRAQEQSHLDTFDRLIRERRIRPTLLSPVWHVAGYALGVLSACLGEKSAMACTVAIEEVIDEHYARQSEELEKHSDEIELREVIHRFREDERRHCEIGIEHGAADAPAFKLMKGVIKIASRTAIWLSTRL